MFSFDPHSTKGTKKGFFNLLHLNEIKQSGHCSVHPSSPFISCRQSTTVWPGRENATGSSYWSFPLGMHVAELDQVWWGDKNSSDTYYTSNSFTPVYVYSHLYPVFAQEPRVCNNIMSHKPFWLLVLRGWSWN